MTKRHFKNATVYMHALSLIYLLSHCSISSPFLLLLRLAPPSCSSTSPKKITSINACYWAYLLIIVWGQIGLCLRQKFAPLTAPFGVCKISALKNIYFYCFGARFTPSSSLLLYFIYLCITATTCPLLALPPRQKK